MLQPLPDEDLSDVQSYKYFDNSLFVRKCQSWHFRTNRRGGLVFFILEKPWHSENRPNEIPLVILFLFMLQVF